MPGGLGFALQPQAYLVQKGLWIFAKSESAFWIETDVGTASAYEDAYGLFSSRDLAVVAAAPSDTDAISKRVVQWNEIGHGIRHVGDGYPCLNSRRNGLCIGVKGVSSTGQ